MNASTIRYCYLDTPLGAMLIAADDKVLAEVQLPPKGKRVRRISPDWKQGTNPLLRKARQQLREYFAGKRQGFELPFQLEGAPFSAAVWKGLADIPYGETVSYQELARRIGRPRASRAVGGACGRNPLPIVLPCHRVVGSGGSLTGFGGGLKAKEQLLALENTHK